jgi:hypothetical protein
MEQWLDCVKIYDKKTDTLNSNLTPEIKGLFEEYVKRIGRAPRYNVWYDVVSPRCIGADDTYDNSVVSNEAAFLTDREDFLTHPRWGVEYAHQNYSGVLSENAFRFYDDCFYENIPDLHKFKDSTILIVGGGPSTKLVDWENIECDHIWTCNHFFLNSRFDNVDLSLIYVNNEVDTGHALFHKTMKKSKPIIALDTSISRPPTQLKHIAANGWQSCVFNQRIFLTCGTVPKLIALAMMVGAKKVCFVGMDGWSREQLENRDSANHAFQEGKKLKIADNYTFDFQRRELVVYWDYLLNFAQNSVEYQNLGEPYDHCVMSAISRQAFPLDQEK